MEPSLYMNVASPPVRAVLLCAKALDVKLSMVDVDLLNGGHLSPEFKQVNPLHTVPTMVDTDGFVLCDSHAIMTYLVEKHGKDTSLYPTDLKKRSIINQRLHFDSGTLFARGLPISKGIVFGGVKKISKEQADSILECYEFVEKFLENGKWIAGDEISVADFSVASTITAWDVLVPIEEAKYPKIIVWLEQMKSLPYYNVAQRGLEKYKTIIKSKLSA